MGLFERLKTLFLARPMDARNRPHSNEDRHPHLLFAGFHHNLAHFGFKQSGGVGELIRSSLLSTFTCLLAEVLEVWG